MAGFLSQLHHDAQTLDFCEQYVSQIYQASNELRALGFTVEHHPSGRSADCFLEVRDGDAILISKRPPAKIISLDTLVELRRLVEQRNVENRLTELLDRFSAVGWVCRIDEDHRIHLEKSTPANTRTYWPTYESLRRIERDLLQAELLRRAYPYQQKLRGFAKEAQRQVDRHLTMFQLMLHEKFTPASTIGDSNTADPFAAEGAPTGGSPDAIGPSAADAPAGEPIDPPCN